MTKFHKQVNAFKVHLVLGYLRRTRGNQIHAAAEAGVSRHTINKILRENGITSQKMKEFIAQ